MKYRKLLLGGVMTTIATVLVSAAFYSRLPDQIATHWNIRGQVDQWSDKFWGLTFLPIVQVVLLLLFLVLPLVSPERAKLDSFADSYTTVCVVVLAFMGAVQVVVIQAALGAVDVTKAISLAMFALFAVIGNLISKSKRNYWMGIRTPWTLESEEVWAKTHRFAGRLFVGCSLIGFVAAMLGANLVTLFTLIMVMSLTPVVYSFVIDKQRKRLL